VQNIFSTHEAADICKAHLTSIINWIKEGKLKAYNTPGGHRRIKEEDLISFMKEYNIPIPVNLRIGPKLILIVDDDTDARDELKAVLGKNSFELDFAADGFEAGRKIYKRKPDLVLLDFRMTGMDGFGVCQVLKKDQETSRIPIIAITVLNSDEDIARIKKSGVFAYVQKPFDIKNLLILIENALKLTKKENR